MKPSKKKTQKKTLKAKADKLFSQAIRLRDADQDGYVTCITCLKKIPWKQAHAGHFIKRRYNATRFDCENVNGQCSACNTFNHGEEYKYSRALDLKYGNGTADRLFQKARQTFKLTLTDLQNVIDYAEAEIDLHKNLL